MRGVRWTRRSCIGQRGRAARRLRLCGECVCGMSHAFAAALQVGPCSSAPAAPRPAAAAARAAATTSSTRPSAVVGASAGATSGRSSEATWHGLPHLLTASRALPHAAMCPHLQRARGRRWPRQQPHQPGCRRQRRLLRRWWLRRPRRGQRRAGQVRLAAEHAGMGGPRRKPQLVIIAAVTCPSQSVFTRTPLLSTPAAPRLAALVALVALAATTSSTRPSSLPRTTSPRAARPSTAAWRAAGTPGTGTSATPGWGATERCLGRTGRRASTPA